MSGSRRTKRQSPLRKKLGQALARVRDLFPFTPLGLVLLGGATAAMVFWGIQKSDLVVYALGIAALAVGGVCFVVTVATSITLYQLYKRRKGEGLAVECTTPTQTGFSMSTLWYVPLVIVRWTWVEPEAHVELWRRSRRKHERVTLLRRGIHDGIVRRCEVLDPFYLTKLAFYVREERKVRALPSTGALKQMRVIRSLASGEDHPDPTGAAEGDRSDIRNYVAGDPIRFILWRVFAKSRQMVVRTPERALSVARKAYAYLIAAPGDEPAAGAARVAIESGVLGTDWVFAADGSDEVADSRVRALEILAQSARATEAQSGAGLARFLQKHAAHGGRVLVFCPAEPGAWLARVAQTAPRGTEFLVCTDGVVPRAKKSLVRRLATVEEPKRADDAADATPMDESRKWTQVDEPALDEVMKTLQATRGRVVLIDRRAGRVYEGGALAPRSRVVSNVRPATASVAAAKEV